MRWVVAGLLSLLLLLGTATPILGASSQDVTVTATGYVCDAPGGFTITYINDYEVGVSWIKGDDAENTMVRAAYGRMPEGREDGYLVYYGEGTSATDWVNMEFMSVPIIYRSWSQSAVGVWEEGETTGFVESLTMIIIGFIALALGLAGLAVWRKHFFLYLTGAVGIFFIAIFLAETSMIYGVGLGLLAAYMGWECVTWWI